MKIKLTTLLLFLVSTTLIAQNDWKRHNGDGYSIEYPNNWTYSDETPNPNVKDVVFAPENSAQNDQFRENVNLTIEDISDTGLTLEAYTKKALDQVKIQVPTAKIVNQSKTKIDGIEAGIFIWTANFGSDVTLKFKQLYALHGEKAYILTFSSTLEEYDKYIEVGEKILNSFKLAK